MSEVMRTARMFESEDIGKMYLVASFLAEWQKETGGTLDDFLEYLEKTFPKKKRGSKNG